MGDTLQLVVDDSVAIQENVPVLASISKTSWPIHKVNQWDTKHDFEV